MTRTIDFQTQIDAATVEPFYAVSMDFSGTITRTYYTTVLSTGDGNRLALNGTQQYHINVARGNTIIFDQSDSTNTGHPLKLSATLDGTTYTTGVSYSGTPGSAGAKTTWIVNAGAPDTLYYKCDNHAEMGAEISILDAPLNLWSGYGELTYDSITYIGSGEFGSISGINQGEPLRAHGLNLTLSGIPSNLISAALEEEYQGREVKVLFGVLTDGVLVQTPYTLFIGKMDIMSINQTGETSIITLSCENSLVDLKRRNLLRFTNEDQLSLYSSDNSLRFIDALQNKEILWGVPYGTVPASISVPEFTEEDMLTYMIENGGFPGY